MYNLKIAFSSAATPNGHPSEGNDFVPLKNFTLLILDGDYTDNQHPFDSKWK